MSDQENPHILLVLSLCDFYQNRRLWKGATSFKNLALSLWTVQPVISHMDSLAVKELSLVDIPVCVLQRFLATAVLYSNFTA